MGSYADPTPFRISTITCTASVGSEINLDNLYEHLEISENSTGITYVEYGVKREETLYKGFNKKFLINRRREKPNKRFDNQLTIIYRVSDEVLVNIKVFKNGNIQMTGVKNPQQGYDMVDTLIHMIQGICQNPLTNMNYKICLINTDFKVGFEIKRDNLFKLMLNEYDNICSFEPCIYPGVKIQYFWNHNNTEKDGICKCSHKCCFKKKSGTGYGDSDCKKITISVFQSGAVIITGSQFNSQIEECYKFINSILYKNIDKIEKKQVLL